LPDPDCALTSSLLASTLSVSAVESSFQALSSSMDAAPFPRLLPFVLGARLGIAIVLPLLGTEAPFFPDDAVTDAAIPLPFLA
jgi:hypothetical protein